VVKQEARLPSGVVRIVREPRLSTRRSRVSGAGVLLASFVLGSLSSSAQAAPSLSNRTSVRLVAPVRNTGGLSHGYSISNVSNGTCVSGSNVLGDAPVFRCFTRTIGFDPCWALNRHASPQSAVCLDAPWATKVIEIKSYNLPQPTVTHRVPWSAPWGVQLTNNQRCSATGAMPDEFNGKLIYFYCSGSNLRLLAYPNRTRQPWTFSSVRQHGVSYTEAGTVYVQTAWYARP
jgi:hypothetical protein